MKNMFYKCDSLTYLDFSNFDNMRIQINKFNTLL